MLKRLLNRPEAETDGVLQEVCNAWGARVFAKVRVADVLPIERTGISSKHFRFALQSHFDFTITDSEKLPLFAVEFDGPGHSAARQRARDILKDELCARFDFPLLRITSSHLKTFRTMNLLSWFVEAWFGGRAFAEAQENGSIPYDEPYDPMWFIAFPGKEGWFPMQLGYDIRIKIERLSNAGKCRDFAPSYWIGVDARENYRIITYLRIDETTGVYATSGMRAQRFGISPGDILDELVLFDLWERLQGTITGLRAAVPMQMIYRAVREYQAKYEMRRAGFVGRPGDSLRGPD